MTDRSQGPGWWQASDGRWYPAESHPDFEAPPPPPPEVLASNGWTTARDGSLTPVESRAQQPWLNRRSNIVGLALALVVVTLIGAGAWAYFAENDSKDGLADAAIDTAGGVTTPSDPCPPDELMSDSGCISIEPPTTRALPTTTTTAAPTTTVPPPVTMPSGQPVFPGYPKLVPIGSVDRRVASWYEGDAPTGELVALAPGVYTPYNPNVPDLIFYLDLPNSGDCAMRDLHFPNSGAPVGAESAETQSAATVGQRLSPHAGTEIPFRRIAGGGDAA